MSIRDTQSPALVKPQAGLNNQAAIPAQEQNIPKVEAHGQNRENAPQKATIASAIFGSKIGGGPQTGKPSGSFHAASSGRTDEPSEEDSPLPFSSFMTRHTPLRWNGNAHAQNQSDFSTLNFLS